MHRGLSQLILPRPVLQLSSHKTEALRSDRVHSPVIHLCHERGGIPPGSGDAETPAHTPMTPWGVGHTHHPQWLTLLFTNFPELCRVPLDSCYQTSAPIQETDSHQTRRHFHA